jgi:hypothetical protein
LLYAGTGRSPAPLKAARSRRQNVARAPELVNDTSHAGTTRLAGTCGYALGVAALLLLFVGHTPPCPVVAFYAAAGAALNFVPVGQ